MHPGKIQVPRRTSRTRLTWQLSNLVKKETLDTLVECGNCKDHTGTERAIYSASLPKVAVLQLVRPQYYYQDESPCVVELPRILTESDLGIPPEWAGGGEWKLTAVIKHHGRKKSSGHYTAMVAHPTTLGRWLEVDDEAIRDLGTRYTPPVSDQDYFVFYTGPGRGAITVEDWRARQMKEKGQGVIDLEGGGSGAAGAGSGSASEESSSASALSSSSSSSSSSSANLAKLGGSNSKNAPSPAGSGKSSPTGAPAGKSSPAATEKQQPPIPPKKFSGGPPPPAAQTPTASPPPPQSPQKPKQGPQSPQKSKASSSLPQSTNKSAAPAAPAIVEKPVLVSLPGGTFADVATKAKAKLQKSSSPAATAGGAGAPAGKSTPAGGPAAVVSLAPKVIAKTVKPQKVSPPQQNAKQSANKSAALAENPTVRLLREKGRLLGGPGPSRAITSAVERERREAGLPIGGSGAAQDHPIDPSKIARSLERSSGLQAPQRVRHPPAFDPGNVLVQRIVAIIAPNVFVAAVGKDALEVGYFLDGRRLEALGTRLGKLIGVSEDRSESATRRIMRQRRWSPDETEKLMWSGRAAIREELYPLALLEVLLLEGLRFCFPKGTTWSEIRDAIEGEVRDRGKSGVREYGPLDTAAREGSATKKAKSSEGSEPPVRAAESFRGIGPNVGATAGSGSGFFGGGGGGPGSPGKAGKPGNRFAPLSSTDEGREEEEAALRGAIGVGVAEGTGGSNGQPAAEDGDAEHADASMPVGKRKRRRRGKKQKNGEESEDVEIEMEPEAEASGETSEEKKDGHGQDGSAWLGEQSAPSATAWLGADGGEAGGGGGGGGPGGEGGPGDLAEEVQRLQEELIRSGVAALEKERELRKNFQTRINDAQKQITKLEKELTTSKLALEKTKATLKATRAKKKTKDQAARNSKRDRKKRRIQVGKLKGEVRELQAPTERRGPTEGWLTLKGGFSAALRRNLNNSAAHSIGLASSTDITGTTVSAYEVKLRAALLSSMRYYHKMQYMLLDTPVHPKFRKKRRLRQVRCVLHNFRCDATNAQIWHKQKLHALLFDSHFITAAFNELDKALEVMERQESKSMMAELSLVRTHANAGAGLGMLGMIEKQILSLLPPRRLYTKFARAQSTAAAIEDEDDALDGDQQAIEDENKNSSKQHVAEHKKDKGEGDHGDSDSDGWMLEDEEGPSALLSDSEPESNPEDEEDEDDDEPGGAVVQSQRRGGVEDPDADVVIQQWCMTSDAGADVAAARRRVMGEVEEAPDTVWAWEANCSNHQYAIIAAQELWSMDAVLESLGLDFRYYPMIAKVFHLWRDNARRIFDKWLDKFGEIAAARNAKRVPPQPISGRWHRASELEEFLLNVNEDQFVDVLTNPIDGVFKHKADAAEAAASRVQPAELDEMRAEDTKAHTQKLGRWARDAMKGILAPGRRFFLAVRLSHAVRKVLDVLLYTIRSKKKGSRAPGGMARLLFGNEVDDDAVNNPRGVGKAELIRRKLIALLDASPANLLDADTTAGQVSGRYIAEDLAAVASPMRKLILKMLANFDRRITGVMLRLDVQCLWLGFGRPEEENAERKRVAARLLHLLTPEGAEEAQAWKAGPLKVAKVFAKELHTCVQQEGAISVILWTVLRQLVEQWRAETDELESLNNMIRNEARKSPNISLLLTDARVAIRKYILALLPGGWDHMTRLRMRDVRGPFNEVLDEAVQFVAGVPDVMNRTERFSRPHSCTRQTPMPTRLALTWDWQSLQDQVLALEWARPWNGVWRRRYLESVKEKPKDCLVVCDEVWALAELFKYQGYFFQCVPDPDDPDKVEVLRPPVMKSSLELMASLFDQAREAGDAGGPAAAHVQMHALEWECVEGSRPRGQSSNTLYLGSEWNSRHAGTLVDNSEETLAITYQAPRGTPRRTRKKAIEDLRDEDRSAADLMADGLGDNEEDETHCPGPLMNPSEQEVEDGIRNDETSRAQEIVTNDPEGADAIVEELQDEAGGELDVANDLGVAHRLADPPSADQKKEEEESEDEAAEEMDSSVLVDIFHRWL